MALNTALLDADLLAVGVDVAELESEPVEVDDTLTDADAVEDWPAVSSEYAAGKD